MFWCMVLFLAVLSSTGRPACVRRATELPDARFVTASIEGVSGIAACLRGFLPAVGVLLPLMRQHLAGIGGLPGWPSIFISVHAHENWQLCIPAASKGQG